MIGIGACTRGIAVKKNMPTILVDIRQGVVTVYGNIDTQVYVANEDVLQHGSEDEVLAYHIAREQISEHHLLMLFED